MTTSPTPVAVVEPGHLEDYLGFRVRVDGNLATLSRVSPTRVAWLGIRDAGVALPVPDRPGRVQVWVKGYGGRAEFHVGAVTEPIEVFPPLPFDALGKRVTLFAGHVRSWSEVNARKRHDLLATIDRFNALLAEHRLEPITPIDSSNAEGSAAYALAQNLGGNTLAEIDDALGQGETVWVLDLNEYQNSEFLTALDGLDGVITDSSGRTTIEPEDAAPDGDPDDTTLVWVTDEDEVYTGTAAVLAHHINQVSLGDASGLVNRLYTAADGGLVEVAWRTERLSYDGEALRGVNAVRVTLPSGAVISAKWRFDGSV